MINVQKGVGGAVGRGETRDDAVPRVVSEDRGKDTAARVVRKADEPPRRQFPCAS